MLKQLQNSGNKITEPRKQVVEAIANRTGLFCVKDIFEEVSGKDVTSTYRTVQLLAELDLIHPAVVLEGEQYYEKHQKKHHHHAICTECKTNSCVKCTIPEKAVKGFSDVHHSTVFTGLCKSCA